MGAYSLENDKFYSFGRTTGTRNTFADKNGEYANFLIPIALVQRGRKIKADKTRQAVQDKYERLDVSCGGIDDSMRIVSIDIANLKANKPRKKKDQREWDAQLSETEEVYRELATKKRQLICVQPTTPSPSGPVIVKDEIPTTPDKQGGMPTSSGTTTSTPTTGGTTTPNIPTPNVVFPTSGGTVVMRPDVLNSSPIGGTPMQSGQTQESGGAAAEAPKKKTWLYVLLGLAAVGGVVYYMRRK